MSTRYFATARSWTAALLAAGMGLSGGASAVLLDRGDGIGLKQRGDS